MVTTTEAAEGNNFPGIGTTPGSVELVEVDHGERALIEQLAKLGLNETETVPFVGVWRELMAKKQCESQIASDRLKAAPIHDSMESNDNQAPSGFHGTVASASSVE